MSTRLVTERLLLRPWRDSDLAAMVEINRDAEVMRHVNGPRGEAATRASHGAMLDHWARFGFGLFAVEGRSDELRGELLGFVGISYPEFLPELAARAEIGWRLARAAWGRGLATEAALVARDDAFSRLALPELISIIEPGNARSQRVATKLGMAVEGVVINPRSGFGLEVWQLAA